MKVTIDAARCTGHGRCYTVAPEVFEGDDEGFGKVRGAGDTAPSEAGDIAPELTGKAELGRASCPEQAITARAAPAGQS